MATILVVDDEYAIVEAIVDALEEHDCVSAANGREALDAARERRPDLIIMDVMMPVMDGRETLEALRRDPELASIPVILMSAALPGVVSPALPADVTFLRKPFDLHALLAAVDAKLARGGR